MTAFKMPFPRLLPRILCLSSLLTGILLSDVPPAWWHQGNPPVIPLGAAENNHGVANIGQAKWMASEAIKPLAALAPDIATQVRTDLAGTPPAFTDRIVDLEVPATPTAEWLQKQKAPLLLGQLKAIARPFYNRLNTVAAPWVLDQIEANHGGTATPGTDYWQVTGNTAYTNNGYYPWNPATPVAINDAPVTIGQLKLIFSFDPGDMDLPEVVLTSPEAFTDDVEITLSGTVNPVEGLTLTLVKLNATLLANTPGAFTRTVSLVEGVNTFTLTATDSAGRTRSTSVTVTRSTASLPQVAITSPGNGATIAANTINVLGTAASGVPLRSVTVNGIAAYIRGGNFEAPNIPLAYGSNTLTATVTDVLDRTASASITVTGPTTGTVTSVTATATPSSGNTPLNVTFNTTATVPGTIQLVTYDFEGDGKALVTATSITSMIHVYGEPGIYYPRITVQTTVGTFSNSPGPGVPLAGRLRVVVNRAGGNTPLDIWILFKKWVQAGDFVAAAECLDSSNADDMKAAILELGPQLAAKMVNDFGDLEEVSLSGDSATYAGEVTIAEGPITFLVDFVKENGAWKIHSF